jgi:hypothetical protein
VLAPGTPNPNYLSSSSKGKGKGKKEGGGLGSFQTIVSKTLKIWVLLSKNFLRREKWRHPAANPG